MEVRRANRRVSLRRGCQWRMFPRGVNHCESKLFRASQSLRIGGWRCGVHSVSTFQRYGQASALAGVVLTDCFSMIRSHTRHLTPESVFEQNRNVVQSASLIARRATSHRNSLTLLRASRTFVIQSHNIQSEKCLRPNTPRWESS
jgi:hypothetical protein